MIYVQFSETEFKLVSDALTRLEKHLRNRLDSIDTACRLTNMMFSKVVTPEKLEEASAEARKREEAKTQDEIDNIQLVKAKLVRAKKLSHSSTQQ